MTNVVTHRISVTRRQYWGLKSGRIKIVIRPRNFQASGIQAGHVIEFNGKIGRQVVGVRSYDNMETALANEPLQRVLPGVPVEDAQRICRKVVNRHTPSPVIVLQLA